MKQTYLLLFLFFPCLHAACYDCPLPYCNITVATTDLQTCRDNIDSNVLIGLEKTTAECQGKVSAMLCAYFYTNGLNNEAADCVNSSKTWCLDYCQELYGCLGSLLTPEDCLGTTPGNTDCTVVNESTIAMFYTGAPTPPVKMERACPDPDAPPSPVPLLFVELGNLYPYLDCVINNATCDEQNLTLITQNISVPNTPIRKEFRADVSFSSLFPAKCSEYAAYVWHPYVQFLAVWYPLSFVAFVLFTIRRQKSPISARSYPLVAIQFFFSQAAIYSIIDPMMYGVTGTCWFGSVYNAVFSSPIISVSWTLRSCRLYYLYRWNQDKLMPEKRGWYVTHREWLLPKRYLLVYLVIGIFIGIIFTIYMVTFPSYYTEGTLFDSGRCWWWDVNPSVQAFAAANGINLGPSVLNPTGYVPYSVNYNSCRFCFLDSSREASYSEFGIVWFILAAVMIFMLRKLNDQYHLWHELAFLLVLYLIAAAISMPFPNDDYAALFAVNNHTHAAIVIGMLLNILVSATVIGVPLFLSYKWEYQGRKRRKEHSINTSEALRNVKIKQDKYGNAYTDEDINYKLFLQDENGMEAFRQFCVESFVAEMASFYGKYRHYTQIKDLEEKRQAAKNIYVEFIKENAPSELNIPFSFRIKYWEEFEQGRVGTLDGEDMKQPATGFLWRPIWSALSNPLGKRRSATRGLQVRESRSPVFGVKTLKKDEDKDKAPEEDKAVSKSEVKGEAKKLPIDEADMKVLSNYFVDVHGEICQLISNDWRRFTASRFYQDFLNALFEARHFQAVGIDQSKGSAGAKSSYGSGNRSNGTEEPHDDVSQSARSISPLLQNTQEGAPESPSKLLTESQLAMPESPSALRSPSAFVMDPEKDDMVSELHGIDETQEQERDHSDKSGRDNSVVREEEIEMMEVY